MSDSNPSDPNRGDDQTTVSELRQLVETFVDEREWQRFHAPKNLAMSIAIEAAELMEHFQWIDLEDSHALADHPEKLAEVGEELADVVGYGLAMANVLGIDLSKTVRAKMLKNHAKYPADVYRGKPSFEKQKDA